MHIKQKHTTSKISSSTEQIWQAAEQTEDGEILLSRKLQAKTLQHL